MLNILVVSDEAKKIYLTLRNSGFPCADSGGIKEKFAHPDSRVRALGYDMALLDLDVEGWRGRLLELKRTMPVIVFSQPDVGLVVEAMKLGATDFIPKPISDDLLNQVLARFKDKLFRGRNDSGEIIGGSRLIADVVSVIRKAAAGESNVLVTGESGTGKELAARAIHKWSPRNECDFVTINCSAIPDSLLESELFGFEKGAFTGADYTKKGLLESADGGTVFFDEIGDVSPLFQTKILRMLQEGEIMRIGGMRPIRVDVRIIAATNRNLHSACLRGDFREDLYYRLNVVNIHMPPLRDRAEDIPLLAMHFLRKHASKRKDVLISDITSDAMELLSGYSYPGNVRELENIVERAISFAESSTVRAEDLPSSVESANRNSAPAAQKLKDALGTYERELIVSALRNAEGNISRAASFLGIYRQQLQRKIKSLKIAT